MPNIIKVKEMLIGQYCPSLGHEASEPLKFRVRKRAHESIMWGSSPRDWIRPAISVAAEHHCLVVALFGQNISKAKGYCLFILDQHSLFSSFFSIYLFKFCCLLFAANGMGMMRPCAGSVISRNKINAENTL